MDLTSTFWHFKRLVGCRWSRRVGGVVLGGDWNCVCDLALDRTGQEPHMQSSTFLEQLLSEADLVWRNRRPSVRQQPWMKVVNGRMSAARMDRFYAYISLF